MSGRFTEKVPEAQGALDVLWRVAGAMSRGKPLSGLRPGNCAQASFSLRLPARPVPLKAKSRKNWQMPFAPPGRQEWYEKNKGVA